MFLTQTQGLYCPPITYIVGPRGPRGYPGPRGPRGLNGSQGLVPVTLITTTNYTPQDTDYFIGVNFSGPCSIILPVTVTGKVYVIKDCFGTGNIKVIGLIDGLANYTIVPAWGSITIVYNGTEWNII